MARSYRYLHLDVFTARLFGGNQLAVFTDGRGLTAAEMQAIAREMNFSESTFVLPSEHRDCDAHLRIFTPAEELPMAGHPTVGTAFALARTGVLAASRGRVVFELGVGPTPVDLLWDDGRLRFAWMTQPLPAFNDAPIDRDALASALRLPGTALHGGLPVQVVSCGVPYLMVPVTTRAGVDAVALDTAAYQRCLDAARLGRLAAFVFALAGSHAALAQGDPPEEVANRDIVEAFYKAAFIDRDAKAAPDRYFASAGGLNWGIRSASSRRSNALTRPVAASLKMTAGVSPTFTFAGDALMGSRWIDTRPPSPIRMTCGVVAALGLPWRGASGCVGPAEDFVSSTRVCGCAARHSRHVCVTAGT